LLPKLAAIQRAISWVVARIEDGFGAIAISVICLLVFVQIVMREAGLPMAWMEETAVYLFVAFAFIAAAVATRQRGHLVVEVLPLVIRKKLALDIIQFSLQLLSLLLIGLFAYLSYGYMMYSWGTPGYAAASRYHLGWPKSFLFIGAVLMTGHYLAIVIKDAAKLMGQRQQTRE
jgi:TRAP-type C4-dicarboxylate transport system permease small subunit